MSGIQVDIWGGDLHQNLVKSETFKRWDEAFVFIETMVEAGLLANVLATDFMVPEDKRAEADAAMRALMQATN